LIKKLQKTVSACGQVDIAKSLKIYNQDLTRLSSDIESQVETIKGKMTGIVSPEMITNFEQIFTQTEKPAESLTLKLKSVEKQLRACGETAKANKIKEYMQETQKKTIDVDSSINELRADIEKCFGTKAVDDFNKKLKETDGKAKNVSLSGGFGSNLKTALGIGTVALGMRKAYGFLKDATNESVDFVEQENLFNVSMGKTVNQYGDLDREASKYYTKAIAFQEKLEEKLDVNLAESMQYQALFNAMSKSMGISSKYAYTLSENFTKLGYDLSSLYNIDPENAMQKLRAGLSGQTKPLRDLGMDITQQSLEPLLDELGIERSVKQLSQAEKMVARYITVLRQASLAHGDFAKTMDSPANQLRVFNAQITAFKRNMGNLWQGLLGGILPYVNAIMMVINELLKMVAKLFGFQISDQNANISVDIGADDLADDLGTATGKAKELKKQLMGFDEINNISLPDNASGGSGGGASVGGIDQRLLDAMKEYDNMMDKVKNKASEIRDKMMEWLGFHRTDDGWKLNEGLTNAEKILDVMKMIGVAIGTWKVSSAITNLFEKLGIMEKADAFKMAFGITLTATGIFAQYKGTKHLLDGDVDIFTLLETFLGTGAGTWGIVNMLKATKWGKKLSLGQQVAIGFGAMIALQGIQISMDGVNTDDLRKQVGGLLESAFGGYLIGNALGGWKIGLAVGLVTSVTNITSSTLGKIDKIVEEDVKEQYEGLNEIIERNNALNIPEYVSNLQATRQAIQDNTNGLLAQIGYTENLVTELGNLVDTNGEVIDGYENRVKFILTQLNNTYGTEYELTGKQITKNGKLVGSYNEVKNSIYKLIEAKKAEILLKANEEIYANALKNRMTLLKKYQQARKDFDEFEKTAYKNGTNTESEEFKKREEQLIANLELSKKAYEGTLDDIVRYEELHTAIIEGDSKKIEEAVSNMTNVYKVEGEKVSASLEDRITDAINYKERAVAIFEQEGQEINEQTRISLDAGIKTVAEKLVEQTNKVKELTPDQINAWKALAEGSEEVYNEKISNVNEDTKLVLEAILGKVDINSPDYIQKWANMANESSERYNQALTNLPEDTRGKIVAAVMAVTGMTESTKSAYENLSETGKNAFNSAMSSMDTDTRTKIQSVIDEINGKKADINTAGSDLASEGIKGAQNKVDDKRTGIGVVGNWFVEGLKNSISGGKNRIWQVGWDLVGSALAGGNSRQKTGSPAKETIKMGNFFTEGYIIGLKKQQEQVRKVSSNLVGTALKELTKFDSTGFTINSNDFKIDTNQFIDYGQISGAIATQSNIQVSSNLPQQVKEAVIEGMRNSKIRVEVEGKADKNAIFKVVQAGADEYYMQTGEPAFGF